MSVILFLIILSLLVVVHELGHFLAAKMSGIRVDEFGLGFPPKAKKLFTWKGSDFTLNWLPFGGFVKIFGENPDEESLNAKDSFQNKNRGLQAWVLVAGVFFNFLFAWLLISLGFMFGTAVPTSLDLPVENPHTVVTTVIPGSPAAEAGLKSGDTIERISRGASASADLSPEAISDFIARSTEPLEVSIERGKEEKVLTLAPREGIIADRPAIGISMDTIGTARLSIFKAPWYGLKITWELTQNTAIAIEQFLYQVVTGHASLSSVTGPVGLVGMVGDVGKLGISYLITFTALISINLAIINLLPIPALDGGRLLFVAIEAVIRRRIKPSVVNTLNTVGFALLILLMVLVTIRDVKFIL